MCRAQSAKHHNRKGRQQALEATGIEGEQRDTTRVLEFPDQKACYEVAGKNKEDIDADKPAGKPRHARVGENHEKYCDRPQSLEIWTKAGVVMCPSVCCQLSP